MRNLILESHSLDPYYNLALEHCLFESIARAMRRYTCGKTRTLL